MANPKKNVSHAGEQVEGRIGIWGGGLGGVKRLVHSCYVVVAGEVRKRERERESERVQV